MAMLRPADSETFVSSELGIFNKPAVDVGILEKHYLPYKPIAPIGNQGESIEFQINNFSGDKYIDFKNILLWVQVRIVKPDGSLPISTGDNTDIVTPTNNFAHTLWRSIETNLQGRPLPCTLTSYHYKAWLKCLLNTGKNVKDTKLACQMYYKDESVLGNATQAIDPTSSSNTGLFTRWTRSSGGKPFEMMTTLYEDIYDIHPLLLSGIPIHLRFTPNSEALRLLAPTGEYKTEILDMKLYIPFVHVMPHMVRAHNEAIKDQNARYYFDKWDFRTFNMPTGSYEFSNDDAFLGDVPNTLYIFMVKSASYLGEFSSNPFHMDNFNLNYASVTIDGQEIDCGALTPSFDAGNTSYVKEYYKLFSDLYKEEDFGIKLDEFGDGYTILKWDIRKAEKERDDPDKPVIPMAQKSNLKILLRFKNPAPFNLSVVVCGLFPGTFSVDSSKNIIVKT